MPVGVGQAPGGSWALPGVRALLALLLALLGLGSAWALGQPSVKKKKPHTSQTQRAPVASPEARLIAIYRLIGSGDLRTALQRAKQLTQDVPHFALAQLTYADLLSAHTRSLHTLGDVVTAPGSAAATTLADLRAESLLRLRALQHRPPPGQVPRGLVRLAPQNRHAIAVDASRARLYLFENRLGTPVLVGDYYISVGKLGVGKKLEGDQRTPLGLYYITSTLDKRSLIDYYGSGALPLNYPNPLDSYRGKTGSGIWLHGTPTQQYARAPLASDGCVVLANPDLELVLRTVSIRSTPVLIADRLDWVAPAEALAQAHPIEQQIHAWLQARQTGNPSALAAFYASGFQSDSKSRAEWLVRLAREQAALGTQSVQLKDMALLHWRDHQELYIATFGEVVEGRRTGLTRRQYWLLEGSQWHIIYEGILS